MRTKLLKFLIETAVPSLNRFRQAPKWDHPIEKLRALPEESIGKELARFIDLQNLMLLPKYEVHDLLHVLLGYGTSPYEELKLQGFMLGNGSATFAGKVLFLLGLFIKPEYYSSLRVEFERGKKAKLIRNYDFNELVTEKTLSLRTELNVPAVSGN